MSFEPVSPARLRSSLPAVDIDGFFQAVDQALNLHLQTEKWPEGTEPTFVRKFPKERVTQFDKPFDLITFHVVKAEMAPSSNAGDRIPRAPQRRETKPDPNHAGYKIRTEAWKEMVTVGFTIWSRTNDSADKLTNWFHRFMMTYGHGYQFFRARGVDIFRFAGRKTDEVLKIIEGQEVYCRTLMYEIRIEYLMVLLEKTLEFITANFQNVDTGETDSIERPSP